MLYRALVILVIPAHVIDKQFILYIYVIGTPAKSTYFSEAEKKAGVPFLYHCILECDCLGLQYTLEDHDITLVVPKGAVSEGEKVHFEIGVTMFGPFIFPENKQPISPIVWLCLLEESYELKKPYKLIVPHFLTNISEERLQYHSVSLAKACHNEYASENESALSYMFHDCTLNPIFTSVFTGGHGVLKTRHFCFYCLLANYSPELARDAGYLLTQINVCLSNQRNEFCFCVTYFLDTCIKVNSKSCIYNTQ